MWRRAFGFPAPPAWPVAEMFTLSFLIAAARAQEPGRMPPFVCLAGLVAAAVVTALRADLRGAVGIGVVAWLFDNGFVVHRSGDLAWTGTAGAELLGLFLGSAIVAALIGSRQRKGCASRTRQDRRLDRKADVKAASSHR
jgi:hypothetical protein